MRSLIVACKVSNVGKERSETSGARARAKAHTNDTVRREVTEETEKLMQR